MINFNTTYTYITDKSKDDFIVFTERDLVFIRNQFDKVLFINTKTKELMLLTIDELLDYKTVVNEKQSQILFIPNLENYISDINLALISRFHHTWYNLLNYYITTNKFITVLSEITKQSKEYTIFPDVADRFKMFKVQNFNDINVVLISLDPYTTDDSTGIAFATKNYKKPYSLRIIEKELQKQFNSTNKLDNSLLPLVNQGVMFLNSALTTRVNKETKERDVGGHLKLWKDFLTIVLERLNNKSESVIFVFLGSKASESARFITSPIHYKIILEHPAKSYHEDREWETNNVFININNVLSNSKNDIKWI